MNRPVAVTLLTFLLATAGAAEKTVTKPALPGIASYGPLAVIVGSTNILKLRGHYLTNLSEIKFGPEANVMHFALGQGKKAEVAKDADLRKIGDTEVEVEIAFTGTAPVTNEFTVVNLDGQSNPAPIIVLPAEMLLSEKEPNGGFKQAQSIPCNRTLAGLIKEAADVDVYQFKAVAGQEVSIRIHAAASKSALDAWLTLSDAAGHSLAANDDVAGQPDAALTYRFGTDGEYFATVMDAHDKGGPAYRYLLSIEVK